MKSASKPTRKAIYGLWPEIKKAVNKGEGWNLSQPAIKERYYNGDPVVTKYHTAALKKRRKEQQEIYKAQKENRRERKAVLMGRENIRNKNDYSKAG